MMINILQNRFFPAWCHLSFIINCAKLFPVNKNIFQCFFVSLEFCYCSGLFYFGSILIQRTICIKHAPSKKFKKNLLDIGQLEHGELETWSSGVGKLVFYSILYTGLCLN